MACTLKGENTHDTQRPAIPLSPTESTESTMGWTASTGGFPLQLWCPRPMHWQTLQSRLHRDQPGDSGEFLARSAQVRMRPFNKFRLKKQHHKDDDAHRARHESKGSSRMRFPCSCSAAGVMIRSLNGGCCTAGGKPLRVGSAELPMAAKTSNGKPLLFTLGECEGTSLTELGTVQVHKHKRLQSPARLHGRFEAAISRPRG
ncbi:hypothetical protein QBC35DRAFT_527844 [Podospora australis]|uniref:Uncharacterized protein n=1 Tax=Podospora australis TaxID=1536484 RepID=A0AAN6X3C4_9PEZI|nr:hypothetical protein QBC35DRAFT_527844 [Podospora australis]